MVGLGAFTVEGLGSIPGQGTEILQAVWRGSLRLLNETTARPGQG